MNMPEPTSTAPASFVVQYAGPAFQVNADRIGTPSANPSADSWSVPLIDRWEGADATDLFLLVSTAKDTGALLVPEGLTLDIITDRDDRGGGFYVLVNNGQTFVQRLTNGWHDADEVAVEADGDDESPGKAREAIAHALHFVAACANEALGLGWTYPKQASEAA